MSNISVEDAINIARGVGFSGEAVVTIVAIAIAESGLDTDVLHTNNDVQHSVDAGILQFNSYWHPEVSTACACNAACAFQEAYRVTKQGTDFSQWTTYSTGMYRSYTAVVQQAMPNAGATLRELEDRVKALEDWQKRVRS